MKVLIAHNFYQQPGGEDSVFAAETRLLRARGHTVVHYTADNAAIGDMSFLTVGIGTVWNSRTFRECRRVIRQEHPDVMHVHNTLPLLSPSLFYAAAAHGVPVVQTLHNYRLVCPNGLCFRDGRCCTDCVGRSIAWPAVVHQCYRSSRAASGSVAAMLSAHRLLGTWRHRISAYLAPTRFARSLLADAGVPAEKIHVKPHFIDPDPGAGDRRKGFALFAGRLSAEKGVGTLLQAWREGAGVPLRVVGDGPLARVVAAETATMSDVDWLGLRDAAEVAALLREAEFLIFPSECFETFGRVIIEAFAAGTPVIAAGLGAAAELVDDGRTGLHFRPGDAADLAQKVRHLSRSADLRSRLSINARAEFEAKYTADINHQLLMDVYRRALGTKQKNR